MLAADALPDFARAQAAILSVPVGGALEALRPACLEQRVLALLVRSVGLQELRKALSFLELDFVLRNR